MTIATFLGLCRSWSAHHPPSSAAGNNKEEPCLSATPPKSGLDTMGALPCEVVALLLEYVASEDVGRLSGASRGCRQLVQAYGRLLWPLKLRQELCVDGADYEAFLERRLERMQREATHWRAVRQMRMAIAEYEGATGDATGVVGMLCDLGMVRDPAIARVLSRRRWQAMVTTVVHGSRTIVAVKKRLPTAPLSFFPVFGSGSEADAAALRATARAEMPDLSRHEGFLGYAMDLIHLRPEHEELRMPVFFALFRNMAVFERSEQAQRADNQFWVALDMYDSSNADTDGDEDTPELGACFAIGHFREAKCDPVRFERRLLQQLQDVQTSVAWARYA